MHDSKSYSVWRSIILSLKSNSGAGQKRPHRRPDLSVKKFGLGGQCVEPLNSSCTATIFCGSTRSCETYCEVSASKLMSKSKQKGNNCGKVWNLLYPARELWFAARRTSNRSLDLQLAGNASANQLAVHSKFFIADPRENQRGIQRLSERGYCMARKG